MLCKLAVGKVIVGSVASFFSIYLELEVNRATESYVMKVNIITLTYKDIKSIKYYGKNSESYIYSDSKFV